MILTKIWAVHVTVLCHQYFTRKGLCDAHFLISCQYSLWNIPGSENLDI
jgi:hypothetical protein